MNNEHSGSLKNATAHFENGMLRVDTGEMERTWMVIPNGLATETFYFITTRNDSMK